MPIARLITPPFLFTQTPRHPDHGDGLTSPLGTATDGSSPRGAAPIVELASMIDDAWTPQLQRTEDLQCSPRHASFPDAGTSISLKPRAPLSPPLSPSGGSFGGFAPGPGVRYRDTAPRPILSPQRSPSDGEPVISLAPRSPGVSADEGSAGRRGGPTVLQSLLQKLVRRSSGLMRRSSSRSRSRGRTADVNRQSTLSSASDGSTAAWLGGD